MTHRGRTWDVSVGRGLRVLVIVLLAMWAVIELYPVIFMFNASLKTDQDILGSPFALAIPPRTESYVRVWAGDQTGRPYLAYFLNSSVILVGTIALLLFSATLAGYALARGRFPGGRTLQSAILLSLAVPAHTLLIPLYFFLGGFGLRNNLLGMILVYTTLGLPLSVILARAYFLSFPVELEEQAQIDGCSRVGAFGRIVLPMSKGILATIAIVNVTWVWSELFFANALLSDYGQADAAHRHRLVPARTDGGSRAHQPAFRHHGADHPAAAGVLRALPKEHPQGHRGGRLEVAAQSPSDRARSIDLSGRPPSMLGLVPGPPQRRRWPDPFRALQLAQRTPGRAGQRLATEDERLGMVGRELAGSHRMRWAMPARAGPAVACHRVSTVRFASRRQADVRRTGWSGVRGSGWRSPGARSGRSGARSSSASHRRRSGTEPRQAQTRE